MDDDAAFDILNDYEPGFSLKQRKEVLWDLDIDGRVPGDVRYIGQPGQVQNGGLDH